MFNPDACGRGADGLTPAIGFGPALMKVACEVRNPLQVIVSAHYILARSSALEGNRAELAMIKESAMRLADLLDRLIGLIQQHEL